MSDVRLGRREAISGGLASVLARAPDVGSRHGRGMIETACAHQDHGLVGANAGQETFRQAFLDWLRVEAGRFAFPVSVGTVTPSCTELRIHGIHKAIYVSLHDHCEINVGVEWDGVGWDLLLWLDAYEKPGPEGVGWVNDLLLPEFQVVHPTREDLWRADVFDELLTWINRDLADATHLAMWGSTDSATWARLVRDEKVLGTDWSIADNGGKPVHLLPVHGPAV